MAESDASSRHRQVESLNQLRALSSSAYITSSAAECLAAAVVCSPPLFFWYMVEGALGARFPRQLPGIPTPAVPQCVGMKGVKTLLGWSAGRIDSMEVSHVAFTIRVLLLPFFMPSSFAELSVAFSLMAYDTRLQVRYERVPGSRERGLSQLPFEKWRKLGHAIRQGQPPFKPLWCFC